VRAGLDWVSIEEALEETSVSTTLIKEAVSSPCRLCLPETVGYSLSARIECRRRERRTRGEEGGEAGGEKDEFSFSCIFVGC
jgi:hypothetical protein